MKTPAHDPETIIPDVLLIPPGFLIYAKATLGDPECCNLIGWLRDMARFGVQGLEVAPCKA